jgi:hypothetical protein
METPRIDFSYNWNNKLYCKAYTTIRLHNPTKYIENMVYDIYLKGQHMHKAQIKAIHPFEIHKLTTTAALIDTGYGLAETLGIITKMYPNINIAEAKFALITLKVAE